MKQTDKYIIFSFSGKLSDGAKKTSGHGAKKLKHSAKCVPVSEKKSKSKVCPGVRKQKRKAKAQCVIKEKLKKRMSWYQKRKAKAKCVLVS